MADYYDCPACELVHQKLRQRIHDEVRDITPLPEGTIQTNAGQQCDVETGPCACGAWHLPADALRRVLEGMTPEQLDQCSKDAKEIVERAHEKSQQMVRELNERAERRE